MTDINDHQTQFNIAGKIATLNLMTPIRTLK